MVRLVGLVILGGGENRCIRRWIVGGCGVVWIDGMVASEKGESSSSSR